MQFVNLHPKIKIAYTTKQDGNMDPRFSDESLLKDHRKKVFDEFGVKSYEIIEAAQVHGSRVLPLDEENTKMWRNHNVTGVDGFVMDQTDTAMMIKLADCVGVILYDPTHHVLGIAHAGWKGAVSGIHTSALSLLQSRYGSMPKEVLVWLSPSAQGCHYIATQKPQQIDDPLWAPFITKQKSQYLVNIPGYIQSTLHKAGILKSHITADPRCTVEDPELFSYQRDTAEGIKEARFAVLAQLLH